VTSSVTARRGSDPTMPKQWMLVGAVVSALVIGGGALVELGRGVDRLELGARVPDFRAVNLATGDSISFRENYQGAVTLVNVWATWCAPCRVEMPAMELVYQSLAPYGFKIAALSIDEGDPEDVRAFGRELGLSFDLLQDRSTKVTQIYQTTGVPESFLLDRDGILVKRIIGPHDWNSPVNRALIQRLLDEPRR
jgi:cytochrome c biogenesis protein CcmG/thiol:disulfide interchange protein DsbE